MNHNNSSNSFNASEKPNKMELITDLNAQNITIIFMDGNDNTTLLEQTFNMTTPKVTVFNATIMALDGIENINYYSSLYGVFVRDMKIQGTWYKISSERYWLYYVNDEFAEVSCSRYELDSNDVILWYYYGEDDSQDIPVEVIIVIVVLISIFIALLGIGFYLKKYR
ncbi:MAG: DUF4430 domain-containing protein [Candidatus Lokiarchaeota archaeon]|nr:DUF4430 domain-containing protein [Candidatus Lokiarchaeota archaeon]